MIATASLGICIHIYTYIAILQRHSYRGRHTWLYRVTPFNNLFIVIFMSGIRNIIIYHISWQFLAEKLDNVIHLMSHTAYFDFDKHFCFFFFNQNVLLQFQFFVLFCFLFFILYLNPYIYACAFTHTHEHIGDAEEQFSYKEHRKGSKIIHI